MTPLSTSSRIGQVTTVIIKRKGVRVQSELGMTIHVRIIIICATLIAEILLLYRHSIIHVTVHNYEFLRNRWQVQAWLTTPYDNYCALHVILTRVSYVWSYMYLATLLQIGSSQLNKLCVYGHNWLTITYWSLSAPHSDGTWVITITCLSSLPNKSKSSITNVSGHSAKVVWWGGVSWVNDYPIVRSRQISARKSWLIGKNMNG